MVKVRRAWNAAFATICAMPRTAHRLCDKTNLRHASAPAACHRL
jgi:hypothetical protein